MTSATARGLISFCIDVFEVFLLVLPLSCCIVGQDINVEELASHPGHLKPLGSQGRNLDVESLDHFPEPSVFFREYVNASKPLMIRGGAKISPAFTLWTDQYFLNFPEGNEFEVVVEQAKKENRSLTPEEASFNAFVKRYAEEDIYMVNSVPDFIGKDVYLPPSLLCPDVVNMLLDKVMWFSSGGTKSVLHYDSAENINCLFSGEKKMYLIDPSKYTDQVNIENTKLAYSNVDVERVDLVKYPGLKDVEYHFVKMEPGDCLYIPYLWFHHVMSVHRNIAVNIWWSASARPNLPDCNLPNTTLDQLNFLGFNQLHSREIIDGVKSFLKIMFKSYDNKINLEQFKLFLTTEADIFEEGATWSKEMIEIIDQVFYFLDEPSQDSLITPDDVKLLSEQTWEKIVPLIQVLRSMADEQFEQDSEEDDFDPAELDANYEKNEL